MSLKNQNQCPISPEYLGPFQEEQQNAKGKKRNIWIFPLKFEGSTFGSYIPEQLFLKYRKGPKKILEIYILI
jgi:hypothetical protein